MSVPRAPLPHLVALLLGVAAALAVGCGDRSNLIPVSRANSLEQQLANVKARIDQGDCNGITADVRKLRSTVTDDLSSKVDRELRQRLRQGVDSLADHAAADCAEVRDGLTQSTETDTQTTETQTTETETQTTDTETQTTNTDTDTDEQPPPEPSTSEPSTATPGGVTGTTPDNGNGGVVPPDDGQQVTP